MRSCPLSGAESSGWLLPDKRRKLVEKSRPSPTKAPILRGCGKRGPPAWELQPSYAFGDMKGPPQDNGPSLWVWGGGCAPERTPIRSTDERHGALDRDLSSS